MSRLIHREFFRRDVLTVAEALLGLHLVHGDVAGRIVETEAYHYSEASCHAHIGRTRRNEVMFWPGGHLYVYRIHQVSCCNVVTGDADEGIAVLIRALEITGGHAVVRVRRAGKPQKIWADGPGKLCRAMGIALHHNGLDLCDPASPLYLERRDPVVGRVRTAPRVGISKATELPWRFLLEPDRA